MNKIVHTPTTTLTTTTLGIQNYHVISIRQVVILRTETNKKQFNDSIRRRNYKIKR